MAGRVRGEGGGGLSLHALGRAGDPGATRHYDDPAYYDHAYRDRRDDVAYYVRLGRLSKGPVLEYGVGTGRVALALARAGVDVTGVDVSRPMLAHLRGKLAREPAEIRRRVRVVRGDMRTFRAKQRFPLVIAPFNAVQHLYDRADMEAFLARAEEHLTPRGRLVFDVLVPHADYLGADPERRFGLPRFRHPGHGLVRYSERFEYDPVRQVLLMELEFRPEDGTAPFTVPLTHRQWFPQEIEAALHHGGFRDVAFSENFTDRPLSADADSLVASARPGRGKSRRISTRGARRGGI